MSLLRIHRPSHLFAAWLSLTAILLLFIAPVISKSRVVTPGHHAAMMAGMDNMTMDEMPDMASDEMPTLLMSKADDPRQQHYLPQSMMDDSACGYCVLLAHLPLDLTTFPPLQSGLVAKSVKPLPFYRPVISRFTPVFFHPRAPPDAA